MEVFVATAHFVHLAIIARLPAMTSYLRGGGSGKTPISIKLRNVGCEFDVYGGSDNQYVIQGTASNNAGGYPCYDGNRVDWLNRIMFMINDFPIADYSRANAVFHPDASPIEGGQGYCHIRIPGKVCGDVKFATTSGTLYDVVDSSGTQITAATATTTVSNIQIKCSSSGNFIPYSLSNSTASLNFPDPANLRLEFTPKSNASFGCQYHDGDNYLAFACNDANDGVDAVQYRCGL